MLQFIDRTTLPSSDSWRDANSRSTACATSAVCSAVILKCLYSSPAGADSPKV
jgi:hypothetical protein